MWGVYECVYVCVFVIVWYDERESVCVCVSCDECVCSCVVCMCVWCVV